MSTKDKYLVIGGLAICLVIALVSPFIASSNPDGLEKSAEDAGVSDIQSTYQAPFQDYTIGGLGKIGEIGVLAICTIITLLIAYIIALLLKRRTPPESRE